jgi:hypothetical protein
MSDAGQTRRLWFACAGLIAGPLLWAASTQLGLILTYPQCADQLPLSAIAVGFLVTLSLAAAYVSWREVVLVAPGAFVAWLGTLVGLVFTFTMILQGLAGLVLIGCEQ